MFVIFKLPPAAITIPGYEMNLRQCHDSCNHVKTSFENSLIIHEQNTKMVYINFVFDFLDLHNVFFENYFANELTRSIVFEEI